MSKKIFNWENLPNYSESFKNNKPFKFCFIKNIFDQEFYDQLYETYPKFDETWSIDNGYRRTAKCKELKFDKNSNDPYFDKTLSPHWNEFFKYVHSDEFFLKMSEFVGIKITKVIDSSLGFTNLGKGDFQLPHIDADGSYLNKIQLMFYFTKNWSEKDPGGTYLSTEEDESSIFFESYDLDNSMVCFEETSISWHGTRYITKDVLRQAFGFGIA